MCYPQTVRRVAVNASVVGDFENLMKINSNTTKMSMKNSPNGKIVSQKGSVVINHVGVQGSALN